MEGRRMVFVAIGPQENRKMKYKIKVQRVLTDIQVIEVEATNLEHAKDKASFIAFEFAEWENEDEVVTAEEVQA